jgi:hypothetical protein
LRFSPGWDKRDAPDYFTVIWGFRFDDTKSVSAAEIKDYLLTYFKGLCAMTATNRKLKPTDSTAIRVSLQKKPTADKTSFYAGTIDLLGVFTDGSPGLAAIEQSAK